MTQIITARFAAMLSACSVVVHLLALTQAEGGGLTAWMMGAMAAACLLCTWRLWRGASVGCWLETLGMYGAMLVVHHLIPLHPATHAGSEHHHGAPAAPPFGFHEMSLMLMWVMAVLAALCLVVAVTRRRAQPTIPHRASATPLSREKS